MILLVDDTEVNLLVLKKMLKHIKKNVHIEICTNGKQAIDKINEIGKSSIELVISDVCMSNFSGEYLFNHIDKAIPIFFYTASTIIENTGMKFISFPIRKKELMNIIGTLR